MAKAIEENWACNVLWMKSNYKAILFAVMSWPIAGYFIWAFHLHVGFPPTGTLTLSAVAYLVLFVCFLVLPFARRLRLGRFLEFEAKVEQVRAEVKDVRSETRELISIMSAVTNTISTSIDSSVVVNIPGQEEAEAAQSELTKALQHPLEQSEQKRNVQEFIDAEESDVHYALARLRIDSERQLRRILGKRLESSYPIHMRGKFITARSLFRQLVSAVPRYESMQMSFEYMLKVCNAAVHGQRVPTEIAYEAIDMGLRILRELENETNL